MYRDNELLRLAKRERWIPLTDDEIKEILRDHNMGVMPHRIDAIREAEMVLKKKNCYAEQT